MGIKQYRQILNKLTLALIIALATSAAFAQNKSTKNTDGDGDEKSGEVSTDLIVHSNDAIFPANASYTFNVKNTYDNNESGTVSYAITDEFNRKVLNKSVPVDIAKKSSANYDFTIPALKTGFYKISFIINVDDYDDTTRRVFGIRADQIKSTYAKPADFDAFWAQTKAELAAIPPDFKMTEKPDMETHDQKVYLLEMKSLGNMTIRGWMVLPAKHAKNRKFPALIMMPGYQATTAPLLGPNDDMCYISVDVRGQGLNRPDMDMRREDYIVSHIEDKNKYIMRGIIMDCERFVDFACSRPEVDKSRICVTGGSMGGYTAIATAALDNRVALCAPQNPFLSDIYNMTNGAVRWPIDHFKDYVSIRPGLTFDKILDNLQYFDTKNFATNVKCPVLMGIGLLDPFVPPNNSFAVYNNINAKKKIIVFKDLGHEVGKKYSDYEILWMRDAFGLF